MVRVNREYWRGHKPVNDARIKTDDKDPKKKKLEEKERQMCLECARKRCTGNCRKVEGLRIDEILD